MSLIRAASSSVFKADLYHPMPAEHRFTSRGIRPEFDEAVDVALDAWSVEAALGTSHASATWSERSSPTDSCIPQQSQVYHSLRFGRISQLPHVHSSVVGQAPPRALRVGLRHSPGPYALPSHLSTSPCLRFPV